MTPEQELRLWLVRNGYPDSHIPIILRYCPQLLDSYTIEEIGILSVSQHSLFIPDNKGFAIRPIVFNALQLETGGRNTHAFVEEAISIFAKDSLEDAFKDQFTALYKRLYCAKKVRL